MATTTLGFPYPASSERVADMAAALQALAQFCDDQQGLFKCGSQSSGLLVAGAVTTVAVVFPTAFPAAGPVPKVVASLENVLGTAVYLVDVRTITRAGFTLAYLRSAGTAAMTAHWVAMAQ